MLIGSLKNSKRNGPYSSIKDKYKLMNHESIVSLVQKSLSKYSSLKEWWKLAINKIKWLKP